MKDDWWFKFQYQKWDDPELRLCTLEAQGFWLRIYIHLRRQGTSSVTATIEDLARIVGGTVREVKRAVLNLHEHHAADVTLCNAENVTCNSRVTLTSRSLVKELSSKEKTKLRVQRHREKADVTPTKRDRVISNKKEVKNKEKKKREEAASPPTHDMDDPMLAVYREFYPDAPVSGYLQDLISGRVKNEAAWRRSLAYWKTNDYRALSIGKICDYYDEEVAGKHNGSKKTNTGGRDSKRTNEPTGDDFYASIGANPLR